MNPCDKLLELDEQNTIKNNNDISKEILSIFTTLTNIKFNFNSSSATEIEKLLCIKHQVIYTSIYNHLFFEILNEFEYNFKSEIKDAIYFLGNLKNPNNNKETINRLIKSPVIQDISFNGKDEFLIYSRQYGNIPFKLASIYFKDKKMDKISDYISNNELSKNCHKHTLFMKGIFNNFYSITSLCPHYFIGSYYHSFTLDKEQNNIIDLCCNTLINKDYYYKIWNPTKISIILNEKIDEELKITDIKSHQNLDRCKLIRIALYKEYLSMINYQGSLNDAPYIKIK